MSAFLTGVLVLIWIVACLAAIHSARYPHPRILRHERDVWIRAAGDILILTGLAVWIWREFLR